MHIVVIAYGPGETTNRAIKRARRLTGTLTQVLVVPAHRAMAPDSDESMRVGTRALEEALDEFASQEPILIIHDDAVITQRGLRRMNDALEAGAPLVVPYTNDLGADHFARTLPPSRQAERILDELASGLETSEAHNVRVTCLLGRAGALRSILTEGFVDPFRMLHDPSVSFVVAPTIASHDGECTARLIDPAGDPRPLLVAAMIVKDEEELLGDCLRSLDGLVDRVEVCDTGSTDSTVDLAAGLGASISRFPWTGDFGAARNHGMERCRDARYVLHIDADERIECTDAGAFRSYLATYGDEYSGFQPLIVNHDGTSETSRFRATRLFPARGTRFDGAIHELPVMIADGRPIHGANINLLQIVHLGYGDTLFRSRDKARRNIEIARRAYEEESSFRTAYDYGRSLLLEDGESAMSAGLFEEAMELIEGGNAQAQAYVYGVVATNRLATGDIEEARRLAQTGLDIIPREPVAAVAFARATRKLDEPGALIELHLWRENRHSLTPLYEVQAEEAEYLGYVASAYTAQGEFSIAYELVSQALGRHTGGIQCWAEILDGFASAGFDIPELFGPMAQIEGSGRIVKEAANVLDPSVTAKLAADYVRRGGSDPDTVAVGLMAGLVSGESEATHTLMDRADVLDADRLMTIANRAEHRGFADIAVQIRTKVA